MILYFNDYFLDNYFFFEILNLYVALGKLNKYTCKGQHPYFLSTTFGTCIPLFRSIK